MGLINPTGTAHFPGGAAEGRNAAVVFMAGAATGEAGLFQTLGDTLQAGLRYTLEVEVGNIASGTANFGFFNLDCFPGYRIDLLAGSTVIASDNNTLSIPEGEFRTSTLEVDIGDSHPALGGLLQIRLVNLNIPGTSEEPGIEVNFDDARLTAIIVPEPATGSLLLFGVAGWPHAEEFSDKPDTNYAGMMPSRRKGITKGARHSCRFNVRLTRSQWTPNGVPA